MQKNKKFRRYLLLVIGIILVVIVICCIHFKNSNNKTEVVELEKGPLSLEEAGLLKQKLEETICVDDEYPPYYGGAYTEKFNLVILLTVKSKKVENEVKDIIGQEEGIVLGYVEYSRNSLRNLQIEVGEKYLMLQEDGDEETIQLLNDVTRTGVRDKDNALVIGVKDISNKKVRQLEEIFGHRDMICYEGTGGNEFTSEK